MTTNVLLSVIACLFTILFVFSLYNILRLDTNKIVEWYLLFSLLVLSVFGIVASIIVLFR